MPLKDLIQSQLSLSDIDNINKALAIADSHIEMKDGIIKTINSKATA